MQEALGELGSLGDDDRLLLKLFRAKNFKAKFESESFGYCLDSFTAENSRSHDLTIDHVSSHLKNLMCIFFKFFYLALLNTNYFLSNQGYTKNKFWTLIGPTPSVRIFVNFWPNCLKKLYFI